MCMLFSFCVICHEHFLYCVHEFDTKLLIFLLCIAAPTYNASEIVYNMTDVYPLDVCWETMSQCHTIDSESFSPMPKDENKVFLEFSENTINGFCKYVIALLPLLLVYWLCFLK